MASSFHHHSPNAAKGSISPTMYILPSTRYSPSNPNEAPNNAYARRSQTRDQPLQKITIARGYTSPKLASGPKPSHFSGRSGYNSSNDGNDPEDRVPLAMRDQIREATVKATSPKKFTQGGEEHGVKVHDFARDMETKTMQKKRTLSLKSSMLFNRRHTHESKRDRR